MSRACYEIDYTLYFERLCGETDEEWRTRAKREFAQRWRARRLQEERAFEEMRIDAAFLGLRWCNRKTDECQGLVALFRHLRASFPDLAAWWRPSLSSFVPVGELHFCLTADAPTALCDAIPATFDDFVVGWVNYEAACAEREERLALQDAAITALFARKPEGKSVPQPLLFE